MKMLQKLIEWAKANKGSAVTLLVVAVMFACVGGCESRTLAVDGETEMTRSEFTAAGRNTLAALETEGVDLQAERTKHNARIAAFNEAFEAGVEDLNEQDDLKIELLTVGTGLISGAADTIAPGAGTIVTSALGVGGWALIGRSAWRRRKEKRTA